TSSYSPAASKAGGAIKFVVISIFIVIIIGASIVLPQVYVKSLEMRLDSIEKEINDPKYNEVKKVNAELASIDGILSVKRDIMSTIDSVSYPVNEVIIAVNNAVPKGCTVSKISYSGDKLTLEGKANDNLAVAELISRIKRLNFLTLDSGTTYDQTNAFSLTMRVGGNTATANTNTTNGNAASNNTADGKEGE
ncbi:MAG: PilN domain-containing protein, partial [Bacillota bacterium]